LKDAYAEECVKFIEGLVEKPSGRKALESIFTSDGRDLNKVLLSAADPRHSPQYSNNIFNFFLKLLTTCKFNKFG